MGFFSDIGNAVSSAASAVGDAVEGAADAVADTVQDAVDTVVDGVQDGIEAGSGWLCAHGGSVLCGVGNVVGGLIDGALEGVQDLVDDALDVVRDAAGIVGALLSLDFPRVLDGLANLLTDAVLGLGLDGLRLLTGGYLIGGVVRYFERSALRRFVERLLAERFAGDRLQDIREFVNLTGARFGFPLPADHLVFMLDSANTPLWDWHERGVLDLYALAGLLSFDSFDVFRPRTVVKSVMENGSDNPAPVTRWTISRYLESEGRDRRLRVYAMSDALVADRLSLASDKCRQIAVDLSWNDGEKFSWFRSYASLEITTEDEYRFVTVGDGPTATNLGAYLVQRGLRTGAAEESCSLVALGAFRLFSDEDRKDTDLGYTSGRSIREGANVGDCATPDRDDGCCVTLDTDEGAGVAYRDVGYDFFFRYVLPHEIGHFVGLCHYGHDGFDHVMWRPKVGLKWFDWSLFHFYLDREPRFTLQDGKNAWRFIADQLDVCLPGEVVIE